MSPHSRKKISECSVKKISGIFSFKFQFLHFFLDQITKLANQSIKYYSSFHFKYQFSICWDMIFLKNHSGIFLRTHFVIFFTNRMIVIRPYIQTSFEKYQVNALFIFIFDKKNYSKSSQMVTSKNGNKYSPKMMV